MRWHEAALERHRADMAALQEARRTLATHLAGGGGDGAAPPPAAPAAEPAASPFGDLLGLGEAAGASASLSPSPDHPLAPGGPGSPSGEAHPPVTGRAVMGLQRGTASELEEVEARASDEEEWGAVLQARGGRCRGCCRGRRGCRAAAANRRWLCWT